MEANPPRSEVEAVADALRRYLSAHPNAVDTAEGIQRWWLLAEYGEVSLQTVEEALVWLEQEGVVRKLERGWSRPAYLRADSPPPAP